MVATILMAAFGVLVVLLMGAVYSAMVISKKTDEMIRSMHDEPVRARVRREPATHGKSIFGNA